MKMAGWLDADQDGVPSERGPLKQINFSTTQADHHRQKEDLEQLGIRLGEITPSLFDQIQDVKARSVLERLTRFESDASKGQGLRQLDCKVSQDIGTEQAARLAHKRIDRHFCLALRKRIALGLR